MGGETTSGGQNVGGKSIGNEGTVCKHKKTFRRISRLEQGTREGATRVRCRMPPTKIVDLLVELIAIITADVELTTGLAGRREGSYSIDGVQCKRRRFSLMN